MTALRATSCRGFAAEVKPHTPLGFQRQASIMDRANGSWTVYV